MEHTQVVFSDSVNGEVQLFSNDKKVGIVSVAIANEKLTVFHTEVVMSSKAAGFQNYCSSN